MYPGINRPQLSSFGNFQFLNNVILIYNKTMFNPPSEQVTLSDFSAFGTGNLI